MQRSLSVRYSYENRYETSPQNILHDALAELETNRGPKLRAFSSRSIRAQHKAQSYLRLSAQRVFPRDSVQFVSLYPNAKERVSILLEIVESQRTYVKFLKMIKEIYYLPMVLGRDDHKKNNFDKPGIPYSECLKMFPRSFTKILASDEILLSKMEERLKLYNSEDYYFAMIGDIFIQFAEFFKKYSDYMIEYEACTTVFRKHRESSLRFQHWLSRRRRICDFDIMSLLVMPVQRTTRQKMLLEKLLVATDASHGEYDILVDAVECMKELADYQNECIRTVSNLKQIEELATLLKIENLVDSDRRFLIQGPAYIDDLEHQVYLFSDSIFFQNNKKVNHYILKKMCISGGSKYSILLSHDDFGNMELFFDTFQEKCHWLALLEVSIRNSRKSWKIPTFVYQQVSFMDLVGRFVKWWTVAPIQEQMAVSPGSLSITL